VAIEQRVPRTSDDAAYGREIIARDGTLNGPVTVPQRGYL
jgi:hypothetical protein